MAAIAPPREPAPPPPGAELDTRLLALQSPAGFAYHCEERDYILAEHLLLLNDLLIKVALGEIKRLIISMPPRHGKSWLTSRYFPAWYLGLNPTHRVMFASYSEDFAAEWGGAARDCLRDFGPELFGVTAHANAAASKWHVIDPLTNRPTGGGMQSAGVGGGLTGRGADLLLIDDPIKNDEEAFSTTHRNKAWSFFNSTAMSRLNSMEGAVVIIMTRWHHDDLVGRLIQQDEEGVGEDWTVVNLPAICDDPKTDPLGRKRGEALWPEKWNARYLGKVKVARGSWVWGALYMGRPTPIEGGLFKKGWVKNARWLKRGEVLVYLYGNRLRRVLVDDMVVFATVDLAVTAKEDSDYTVAMVFGLMPDGNLVVLEVYRDQLEGPDILPLLEKVHEEWELDGMWIEAVQFQNAVVQDARKAGLPARALKPKKDKVARAIPATAAMEGGKILFIEGAAYVEPLLGELTTFPHAKNNDQVDCFAYGEQVARVLRKRGGRSLKVGGAGANRKPTVTELQDSGRPLTRHQRRQLRAQRTKTVTKW